MGNPVGVHLVGSVPLKSEEEVWSKVFESLPGRCATVPDGETGSRFYFTRWQKSLFPRETHGPLFADYEPVSEYPKDLESMPSTKYDEAAVESYQKFSKLRHEGKIPLNVRLQVCIPGLANTIYSVVAPKYQSEAAKIYEQRLLEDAKRLQEQIPSEDLAIQIDLACEFGVLESSRGRMKGTIFGQVFTPWWISSNSQDPFAETKKYLMDNIVRLAKTVKPEIPLGFHLCYGDVEHSHFMQPENVELMVDIINEIAEQLKPLRTVEWVHMPVPKDRKDAEYFTALNKLNIGHAKLFLGVVHAHDETGTEERIKVAQSVYEKPFGVATECGMGRTPVADLDSIFAISESVSAALT